eukprot:SAG11_NODE_5750_length_1472_cov_1.654042_2_plen_87_part_01
MRLACGSSDQKEPQIYYHFTKKLFGLPDLLPFEGVVANRVRLSTAPIVSVSWPIPVLGTESTALKQYPHSRIRIFIPDLHIGSSQYQ